MGIGDFYAANQVDASITEPTERVDMVNGRLRIRQLPGDPRAEGEFRVMVVDNSPSPSVERGVVKWQDANLLDCKWTLNMGFLNHVYTAVGPPGWPCPDDGDAVGIGIELSGTSAPAKFTVRTDDYDVAHRVDQSRVAAVTKGAHMIATNGQSENIGAHIEAIGSGSTFNYGLFVAGGGSSARSRGVHAETSGGTVTAYAGEFIALDGCGYGTGVYGEARNATVDRVGVNGSAYGLGSKSIGVAGTAEPSYQGGASPAGYQGVAGFARGASGGVNAIGVYGEAPVTGNQNSWAGYFNGDVQVTGQLWNNATLIFSDASIKTGQAAIQGGATLELLNQLTPKSYSYTTDAAAALALPAGVHYGFIAQEVEQVLPELVGVTRLPDMADSTGAIVAPAVELKGVNYIGMIPLLVGALQASQQQISGLQQQMQSMQAQLAACCAAGPTDADQRSGAADERLSPAQERLLRIAPNPFADRTTLSCTLERAGRMQLLVNSSDGRDLRVLSEGQRAAGVFQYEWTTADLAPGVYYVTLLLDGEPQVKRAVKVRE